MPARPTMHASPQQMIFLSCENAAHGPAGHRQGRLSELTHTAMRLFVTLFLALHVLATLNRPKHIVFVMMG